MKTPCQADPDLWADGNPAERWQAQQACQTCPRLTACLQEALDNPADRIGVRGGRDWTVSKNGESLAPVQCQNQRCRRMIPQHAAGVRRRFCNDKCRRTASGVAA